MSALEDNKRENFAQGLAYGFTPAMAAEEAGLSYSPVEASHKSQDPDIVARVNELVARGNFDLANEHIRIARQLEVDRDFAYRLGNPAAAINATIQRAKILGVFVERVSTESKVALSSPDQLTPEEWSAKFGKRSD